jgi:NADH dehydrogenase
MSSSPAAPPDSLVHRVVVVGGGFGGVRAVQHLRHRPLEVTLIDRRNFHLFQPLTYQVATGALSPGDVAYPLRAIFTSVANVRVLLAEVSDFDLETRTVILRDEPGVEMPTSVPYDTLIVAAGSSYSYFGHEEWERYAPEVKTLESAIEVRSRIFRAFERAELATDADERAAEMTFVVVGAGPTGVEMAGQIGELARDTLRHDFRQIDPRSARVVLIDAGDRILQSFPPSLSAKAERGLKRLGVTTMVNRPVVDVDGDAVTVSAGGDDRERIATRTAIWAAGVNASPLAGRLADRSGAELDKAGRITVEPDLTLAGHPEVLVLGDMVRVRDGAGGVQDLPGVAPVAIQQGVYAAKLIRERLNGRSPAPFRYRDKGNVATIGRGRAVVDLHVIRLSGLPAWLGWVVIHLWYLMGFQNRLQVILKWSFSFVTHGRAARLIDEPLATASPPPR